MELAGALSNVIAYAVFADVGGLAMSRYSFGSLKIRVCTLWVQLDKSIKKIEKCY